MLNKILMGLILACLQINAVIDVNDSKIDKKALLLGAIRQNNAELVKLFVASGLDVNSSIKINSPSGLISSSYLIEALNYYCLDVIKTILDAGANLNAIVNSQALHNALNYRYQAGQQDKKKALDIIKLLLSYSNDIDLEATNKDGKTVFNLACDRCDFELIEILQNYYKNQANKISRIEVQNNSKNVINVLHKTDIPANAKAIVTTEITKNS
jgi:ankyrin repeat protein